jgi:inosine-uridine nucleoside N-ribohydrolase
VPERLILDTDPGIDDAAALFFALASPEVSVDVITTVFGNVSVDQAAANALRLVAAASRRDIPVHRGASKPLRGAPAFATHIHGSDGLGDVELPEARTEAAAEHAVEAIIAHVARHPGEVTIMAIAPLTNVALALTREPALAKQIKRVVCMGGAVLTMGNASPVASANFFNDPLAAAIVYESGVPVVQVGLDVCQKVYVTDEQLERLGRDGGTAARRVAAMSRFIKAAYARVPRVVSRWTRYNAGPWAHFNDLAAMGFAILPDAYTSESLPVVIETEGLCRGQTVADFRGQLGRDPNATVPLDVDGERVSRLFVERVARL